MAAICFVHLVIFSFVDIKFPSFSPSFSWRAWNVFFSLWRLRHNIKRNDRLHSPIHFFHSAIFAASLSFPLVFVVLSSTTVISIFLNIFSCVVLCFCFCFILNHFFFSRSSYVRCYCHCFLFFILFHANFFVALSSSFVSFCSLFCTLWIIFMKVSFIFYTLHLSIRCAYIFYYYEGYHLYCIIS